MGDSRLTKTEALRLAVKLLVVIALFIGPYMQSAKAGMVMQTGTGGHHAQLDAGVDLDYHGHHVAHAGDESGDAPSEMSGDLDAETHGGFANCCELFCVGSALVIAHIDLPVQIPSALIHSHADAGVGLGEWATPHRPPQRLI